jgi:hypothetical protein
MRFLYTAFEPLISTSPPWQPACGSQGPRNDRSQPGPDGSYIRCRFRADECQGMEQPYSASIASPTASKTP